MSSRTHPRRREQRGSAAVETALSLLILTFVAMAGIYFTDAMVVRQRLTTATSRAARICAVRDNLGNIDQCIDQQIRASIGPNMINRCADLRIDPDETAIRANLSMITARVSCRYVNDIARFLQFNDADVGMTLRAQATMPVAR